jgi:hypothetical protein
MVKTQKSKTLRFKPLGALRPALLLGSLFLSAFLWVGCQSPDAVSSGDDKESVMATQPEIPSGEVKPGVPTPAPQPAPVTDKCSGPGPITLYGSTPRCTNVSRPVCGCNGVTYVNGCLAWTYNVNVLHDGACLVK